MFSQYVGPLIEILYLDLLNLNSGILVYLAFSKQLSGMCEFIFTMYDLGGIFLLSVDFLRFVLLALPQTILP